MQNQLQRAMELAKKTGDRLIVFDNVNSTEPYVVMNLEEYERLAIKRSDVRGLTEDELLDKINRDIAIWKSEQEFFNEYLNDDNYDEDIDEEMMNEEPEDNETEEEFYFEPEELKIFNETLDKAVSASPRVETESAADNGPEEMEEAETGKEKKSSSADKYFYGPFTEEEMKDGSAIEKALGQPKKWTIPTDRKKAADTVIDEDKSYLEEVGELPY